MVSAVARVEGRRWRRCGLGMWEAPGGLSRTRAGSVRPGDAYTRHAVEMTNLMNEDRGEPRKWAKWAKWASGLRLFKKTQVY
jgi:hypothetical protein